MPEAFYMPDPVLVHNNIAVYNTFRNDQLNDPRDYWFTTDPFASEHDDHHSFDIREFASYSANRSKEEILRDILDQPESLPLDLGETIDDICYTEQGFFKTTPEQDKAFELAARIDAHVENYYPSLVSFNVTLPSGQEKGIYAVPQEPSGHMTLHIHDRHLKPNDYAALLTEKPAKVVETCFAGHGDFVRDCCTALDVEVPSHLRQPLADRLSDAQTRANENHDNDQQQNRCR